MKSIISVIVTSVLVVNISACGTLLYPERKGQVGGRIDVGVALLDALGLFVWFIPGVIAFAVDFSNGTIYLPSGSTVELTPEEIEAIQKDGEVDMPAMNHLIEHKLAKLGAPPSSTWQVRAVDDHADMQAWMRMHNQPALALR